KGRMLPTGRTGPLDSRVDRQQCGARRRVLQSGPGGPAERLRTRREAFVNCAGPAPEREDLRAREFKPGNCACHMLLAVTYEDAISRAGLGNRLYYRRFIEARISCFQALCYDGGDLA